MKEIAISDVSAVLGKAIEGGKIFDGNGLYDTPVAQFYDLDLLDAHMANLKETFGPTFHHCIAIKSNSVSKMLRHAYDTHGFGIECASIGEVMHAIRHCKIPKEAIVFDSPCKTRAELEFAIRERIYCNLDNFDEYERAKKFIDEMNAEEKTNLE